MKTLIGLLTDRLSDQAIAQIKVVIDTVWFMASIIIVPSVATAVLVLALQEPSVVSLNNNVNNPPTMVLASNTSQYVNSPVSLGGDVKKAEYFVHISDTQGRIVYRYPRMITDYPSQIMSFRLPNLKSGTYFVNSTIRYALNPLKTTELNVRMAKVVVP